MSENVRQILPPQELIKNLTYTTPLMLSIEAPLSQTLCYQGQFIGIEAPSHFIIKTLEPSSPDQASYTPQLDDYINVRFKSNSQIMGFKSQISHLIQSPYQWIVIDYPSAGYGLHIRKAHRYPAYLLANVNLTPLTQVAGVIKDISISGCRFVPLLIDWKLNITPGTELELKTRLPMLNRSVALKGIIKHHKADGSNAIGIEFRQNYSVINELLVHHQESDNDNGILTA